MYIFEHWHEEADYAAYVATRGDKVRSIHWSPYHPAGVVNADP
jgi:hypothetical protein|tara:strand:- start:20 stop:148 length:129 start_codon:yes stop_codon:yes gene_type:complete